ncbi:MAG: energy-coupling factor ABC transporter ATP-binding protein [Rhodocyclaceae bacterium]|nr:energy-coupling factor ABC transporter ATP-binding protein [Rhodocyclaceae bacterium]
MTLTLTDVCYAWDDGNTALAGLSASVARRDKIVVLGANGSGKSTLLMLLNGLIFPTSGAIAYEGVPLSKSTLAAGTPFARRFRSECALLFQQPEAMLFNPSVSDEIAYGLRRLALPDEAERVAYWASTLGLGHLLDERPYRLSGGEKQKLALACVLALKPRLLLLDEPTANLDPMTVAWLADYLLDTSQTVIIATHNLSLAAELGARCWILSGGRLLFDGPTTRALADLSLLEAAGLAHRHRHRHGPRLHRHLHGHDWNP